MNAKQRKQYRKVIHHRIIKELNRLKTPKLTSGILTEEKYSVMLKNFNRPNINGILFNTDNLSEVIDKFKQSLPIYCELEPFINRLGSTTKNSKFETNIPKNYFSVNLSNTVARLIDIEYNKETHELNGTIKLTNNINYPGYTTLINDIVKGKVFFGVRGVSEKTTDTTQRLLKLITLDVHFNSLKLRG